MRNLRFHQRLQLGIALVLLAGCQSASETPSGSPKAGPAEFVVIAKGKRGEWKGRMRPEDRENVRAKHDQAEELFPEGLGFDVDEDAGCEPFDAGKVVDLTQLLMDKDAKVTWRGSEMLVETNLPTPERDSLITSMRSLLRNGVNVVVQPMK